MLNCLSSIIVTMTIYYHSDYASILNILLLSLLVLLLLLLYQFNLPIISLQSLTLQ